MRMTVIPHLKPILNTSKLKNEMQNWDEMLHFSECSTIAENWNTATQIEMGEGTVEHFPGFMTTVAHWIFLKLLWVAHSSGLANPSCPLLSKAHVFFIQITWNKKDIKPLPLSPCAALARLNKATATFSALVAVAAATVWDNISFGSSAARVWRTLFLGVVAN